MNKSTFLIVAVLAACSSDPASDVDRVDATTDARGDAENTHASRDASDDAQARDGEQTMASNDGGLRCEQVQDEWQRRVELAVSDLTQCTSDHECSRFFAPNFDCRTLHVRSCPIAIRQEFASDIDAMRTRSWAVAADICERVEPGCTATPPLCGAVTPHCNQGRCELMREPVDEETLACGRPLSRPDAVKNATPSPDGEGFCCAASFPTCDCGSFGGFVEDRCDCGNLNAGACDLAPPDWLLETDEHGCKAYRARSPQTACCNCFPRDASVAPALLTP